MGRYADVRAARLALIFSICRAAEATPAHAVYAGAADARAAAAQRFFRLYAAMAQRQPAQRDAVQTSRPGNIPSFTSSP